MEQVDRMARIPTKGGSLVQSHMARILSKAPDVPDLILGATRLARGAHRLFVFVDQLDRLATASEIKPVNCVRERGVQTPSARADFDHESRTQGLDQPKAERYVNGRIVTGERSLGEPE
jgi:hypothetical protein